MKSATCLAVLLCTVPATAQPAQPAPRLPDAFGRSAFRVLKMIEGEAGRPIVSGGHTLVPRETNQAIDDLDADAATADERTVVTELHTVFDAKLRHNEVLHLLSLRAHADLVTRGVNSGPADVLEAVQNSPVVVEIHSKETLCFTELEAALRGREARQTASCDRPALHVSLPEQ